jgi:magnesium transporter
MITVVDKRPHGAKDGSRPACNGWLNVVDPDAAELARLRDEFGMPEPLIAHALDLDERPRVDTEGEVTLVVLRVPIKQGAPADMPYGTLPLGLVISAEWIATVSRKPSEVLGRLRAYVAKDWPAGAHHRFVLHALDVTAQAYLSELRAINRHVDALEIELRGSLANREVIELLKYQKCLVYFATALRATELMLERLQRSPALAIPLEDQGMLEDVLVEIRQAIDVTTISSNILGETMDAFASIISNNLNGVMKFLAAITIVLSFPITIASLWGMNVDLPLQRSPHAFAWLLWISAAVAVLVAVAFRRMRWL